MTAMLAGMTSDLISTTTMEDFTAVSASMSWLLDKYGYTEDDALKLCAEHGLLSPIYDHCRRNGCWFCPNASDAELRHMLENHPDLFDRLLEWETEDNVFHRRITRRETPSELKARLLRPDQAGLSSSKKEVH